MKDIGDGMPTAQDWLFFSALAYQGPQSASFYNTQLMPFGHENWQYLAQSGANSNSYFGVAFKNVGEQRAGGLAGGVRVNDVNLSFGRFERA